MRWRATLGLLVVALVTGGCGVHTDGGVELADPADVPFGLLETDREPVLVPGPTAGSAIDVYFFHAGEQRLVPVTRRVDAGDVEAVIGELESGPSAAEASLGLQSALVDVESVATVEVEGGIATVDLTGAFTDLGGDGQLVAIAQLVFSLTDRPGVDQVTFTIEGEATGVRRGDGTPTREPLDRDDFVALTPL